jgi:hypothetical protein
VADPADATTRWRARPGPDRHEQLLTGTGLVGRTTTPAQLIVHNSEHWVWSGTGVKTGTAIEGLVSGQVDGIDPAVAGPGGAPTVLASSPFVLLGKDTTEVQSTAVSELANGAFVFSAGTQGWQSGLVGEHPDARIQAATANLLHRMSAGPSPADDSPVRSQTLRQMWHRVRTGMRSGRA